MYCDRRECSRGIRRRSTHLFSKRSPGDVGQDEQDSVSCRGVKHNLEELLVSHLAHFKRFTCQEPESCCHCSCCCCRCAGRPGEHKLQIKADSPSSKDKDRAPWLSASSDSCMETTFWHWEGGCRLHKDSYRISQSRKRLMKKYRVVRMVVQVEAAIT